MTHGRTLILFALVAAASGSAAAHTPDDKIDHGLLLRLTDDAEATVPFFVLFTERADLKALRRIPDPDQRAAQAVRILQAVADRGQRGVRDYLRVRNLDFVPFWIHNKLYVRRGTLDLARAIAQRPEVAAIVPEIIYELPIPYSGAASATQGLEWNVSMIGADQVWNLGYNGANIVVANIDTGVQYNHPALDAKYRGKTGSGYTHTGNWSDPSALCGAAPCDNVGHGTHTMGTMVGWDSAGNQVGVAPGATWIACKGCESNSCSSAALTACAQWVMSPAGNTDLRPHVVNNSWGGGAGDTWYENYVQQWRTAGIFPAFSVGNAGPACTTAGSPGDYPEAFATGAVDSAKALASFSSRGPSLFALMKPNVSAPGVNVRSSVPIDSYANYSGTSMASPHTAGLVALIWSAAAAYARDVTATEALVTSTASPLTTTAENCGSVPGTQVPNNSYGYGLINAPAAVNKARGSSPGTPPTVTITQPANGTTVGCGTATAFTATASGAAGQNLSASIQWSENGTLFASGASASKTFACTETGIHTVTAFVRDSNGLTDTDQVGITVTNPNPPAAPIELSWATTTGGINLTWRDNSNNETSFVVERKGKTWTTLKTIASPDPKGLGTLAAYYDSSITRGNWQYRVRAQNTFGLSAPSNIISVKYPAK